MRIFRTTVLSLFALVVGAYTPAMSQNPAAEPASREQKDAAPARDDRRVWIERNMKGRTALGNGQFRFHIFEKFGVEEMTGPGWVSKAELKRLDAADPSNEAGRLRYKAKYAGRSYEMQFACRIAPLIFKNDLGGVCFVGLVVWDGNMNFDTQYNVGGFYLAQVDAEKPDLLAPMSAFKAGSTWVYRNVLRDAGLLPATMPERF